MDPRFCCRSHRLLPAVAASGDDKPLHPRQHGVIPDLAVPFRLARRQLRQLLGGLRGQVLVSFCASSAFLLLLTSGANVWLTLRMADAANRHQVEGHLNALLVTWQGSSSLPHDQRLRLLQRSLNQINDPSNLYFLHLGGVTLLRPPQSGQLPPAYLGALRRGVHSDATERLVNSQGDVFEVRHYPFIDHDSHAHVAHRLEFVASYTREQLRLVLSLLPIGLLLALLVGLVLSRRIVRPILALDKDLMAVNPETLEAVVSDLDQAPAELRHHAKVVQQLLSRLHVAWDSQKLFVSAVNHELRNSLVVMEGSIRWLQRSSNSFSPRQKQALANALAENKRLAGLVSDLLDICRHDFKRLEVALQPLDVLPLMRQCRDVQSQAQQCDVRIETEEPVWADPSPYQALANPDRLTQVLMNLLENAAKYSAPGSLITLRLSLAERLLIRIIDQGVGIAEVDRPHIFERFYRGSITATTVTGTGLGLTLAQHLVEAMGGTLILESSGPDGSVFLLSLPRPSR